MPLPRVRLAALVALGLVAVALAGLAYAVARKTSLFAVETILVSGAPAGVEQDVAAALARFSGVSLVGLDAEAVERVAATVPAVRSTEVDRDFPGTLRVAITTERPVAVVRQGEGAWLVAASGKVLEPVTLGTRVSLPRVWLPEDGKPLAPALRLAPDGGGTAVRALAQVPVGFPLRVVSARGRDGDLTLVLPGETELRLGEAADVRLKLAVAASVLASLGEDERDALAYLDLSVPARPVGAPKSQVEA